MHQFCVIYCVRDSKKNSLIIYYVYYDYAYFPELWHSNGQAYASVSHLVSLGDVHSGIAAVCSVVEDLNQSWHLHKLIVMGEYAKRRGDDVCSHVKGFHKVLAYNGEQLFAV